MFSEHRAQLFNAVPFDNRGLLLARPLCTSNFAKVLRAAGEEIVVIGHGRNTLTAHFASVATLKHGVIARAILPDEILLTIDDDIAQHIGTISRTAIKAILETTDRVIEELIHEAKDHKIAAVAVVLRIVGPLFTSEDVIEGIRLE